MFDYLEGYCELCGNTTTFQMDRGFYRSLQCQKCLSWPAQRALWFALNNSFPNWRDLRIHESSPGGALLDLRLINECTSYTASQYDPSLPGGTVVTDTLLPCKQYVVQDLQAQTFDDESFDLVITAEVFEHIMDPKAAIKEIARTLKPGGATLMAVPVARKFAPTRRRARLVNGEIEHLLEPEYHGNPMSGDGALVTVDWGYDIAAQLSAASGLYFIMGTFEDLKLGIRDEFNQILIGYKAPLPDFQ